MNFYFATHLLYLIKVSNICSKKKHFFVFFYLIYTYFFHYFSLFVYFLFLCRYLFILIFPYNVYFFNFFRLLNTSVFVPATTEIFYIFRKAKMKSYLFFVFLQETLCNIICELFWICSFNKYLKTNI